MANGAGRSNNTSETRDRTRSVLPLKVADDTAKRTPTMADTRAALRPTMKVGQAPASNIENTSRPNVSVPSQWVLLGGAGC